MRSAALVDTAQALRALYAGDTSVRIAEDADTSRLFVVAPPELHAAIAEQLGSPGISASASAENPTAEAAPRLPRNRGTRASSPNVELFVTLTSAGWSKSSPCSSNSAVRACSPDRGDCLVSRSIRCRTSPARP